MFCSVLICVAIDVHLARRWLHFNTVFYICRGCQVHAPGDFVLLWFVECFRHGQGKHEAEDGNTAALAADLVQVFSRSPYKRTLNKHKIALRIFQGTTK